MKIFKTPFAATGDKISIPTVEQPGGEVSQPTGWTPDYQLPNTDPNYKPVGRAEMNGVFYEITEALGQVQQFGFARWTAISGGWPQGARVEKDGVLYQSTQPSNTEEPPHASWQVITFGAGPFKSGAYADVVQETGQSTSDVMSQKAVTDLIGIDNRPSISGSVTFTRSSNTIATTGIRDALGNDQYGPLAVGDVVSVTGSSSNNGLYTVESISSGSIIVNDAHKGGAGPLSLTNETRSCTVGLWAKSYNAPLGLGQGWVKIPSMQRNNTRTNSTGRTIQAIVYLRGSITGDPWIEAELLVSSGGGGDDCGLFASNVSLRGTIPNSGTFVLQIYDWLDLTPNINNAVFEWWELR